MMSMVRDLVKRKKQYCASVAQTSKATVTEEYLVLAVQRILLKGASEDYLLCHVSIYPILFVYHANRHMPYSRIGLTSLKKMERRQIS